MQFTVFNGFGNKPKNPFLTKYKENYLDADNHNQPVSDFSLNFAYENDCNDKKLSI